MSDARDILEKLAAQRAHDEQEARRWEAYRKLCGPPRWFMLTTVALGVASVALLFAALESAKDKQALAHFGRVALTAYAMVWPLLLIYVETRRRRGLKKILAAEAPDLVAKLKDERIL